MMAFSWHKMTLQIMMLICEMCSNYVLRCSNPMLEKFFIHPDYVQNKVVKHPSRELPINIRNPLLPDEKSLSTSKDVRKQRCVGCKGCWVASLR